MQWMCSRRIDNLDFVLTSTAYFYGALNTIALACPSLQQIESLSHRIDFKFHTQSLLWKLQSHHNAVNLSKNYSTCQDFNVFLLKLMVILVTCRFTALLLMCFLYIYLVQRVWVRNRRRRIRTRVYDACIHLLRGQVDVFLLFGSKMISLMVRHILWTKKIRFNISISYHKSDFFL